jgi:hypothetical protein
VPEVKKAMASATSCGYSTVRVPASSIMMASEYSHMFVAVIAIAGRSHAEKCRRNLYESTPPLYSRTLEDRG